MSLYVEWLRDRAVWALKHEQIVRDQVLFTVRLMAVYEHERDMDRGRFSLFCREPLPHVVEIEKKAICDGTQQPWFEAWINWLAEHCREPWSVSVEMIHVGQAQVKFSFGAAHDAVMFKMVWV